VAQQWYCRGKGKKGQKKKREGTNKAKPCQAGDAEGEACPPKGGEGSRGTKKTALAEEVILDPFFETGADWSSPI